MSKTNTSNQLTRAEKNKVNPDNKITREVLEASLPRQLRTRVSDELVDDINQFMGNPEFAEIYRENLLGFTNILLEGKFKLKNYVDAARYVSYKLLGNSHKDAYIKTFPDKYQRFLNEGVGDAEISAYASAYHRSKLVTLLLKQTLIPVYVANADMHQKALNKLAHLMMTARSEKVQCDAADRLAHHTKPPEETNVNLNIGLAENQEIVALKETINQLANKQKELIDQGKYTAKEIAEMRIIDGSDYIEVEDGRES